VKNFLMGVMACTVMSAAPVWAGLGGAPAYPSAQRAPAVRTMAAANGVAASYTVTTATLDNGTVIHEYLDSAGTVFAVSWRGPRVGSLESLLGSYFPAWQKGLADARAARGGGHGPVSMHGADLAVEAGGHMGALTGRAWLPKALPQGMNADQIQ
jgi:hypothetical protein